MPQDDTRAPSTAAGDTTSPQRWQPQTVRLGNAEVAIRDAADALIDACWDADSDAIAVARRDLTAAAKELRRAAWVAARTDPDLARRIDRAGGPDA